MDTFVNTITLKVPGAKLPTSQRNVPKWSWNGGGMPWSKEDR